MATATAMAMAMVMVSRCQPSQPTQEILTLQITPTNLHQQCHLPHLSCTYTNTYHKIITLPMTDDSLTTTPVADATDNSHPLTVLLTKDVGLSPEQVQLQPQFLERIKMMPLRLPHTTSLDMLPSPTNKWSATTYPIIGEIFGIIKSTNS
jgi:hypothetical protein